MKKQGSRRWRLSKVYKFPTLPMNPTKGTITVITDSGMSVGFIGDIIGTFLS